MLNFRVTSRENDLVRAYLFSTIAAGRVFRIGNSDDRRDSLFSMLTFRFIEGLPCELLWVYRPLLGLL